MTDRTEIAGIALVVEDDELVRMSTVDMLGDLGWQVLEAADAPAALAQLGDDPRIGLLVTDLSLEGSSGHDLIREARQMRPALRVLVASGYAESRSGGGEVFLSKPFGMAELAAAIQRALREPSDQAAS